ncbi:PKD domain-containing protein [uncultured Dokdonia sp.]|uniref:PKD domain-containing protein n=1 Tax=uncultured Dokdonia sp. TaxID=575653 RepID=UPI002601A755|nr:PKD domain-containing protein [uncultured Dokdonia sp.]
MNTKLDNITVQYRKFNENQALTEDQLNEFIDYFEDQDRLSRTRLSGVGVVCGFRTASSFGLADPNLNGLGISQGAGVTTDGDIITLRNNLDGLKEVSIDLDGKVFTHYRLYETDNEIFSYPHFTDLTSMIELKNLSDIQDGEVGFVALDEATLAGKVVLLYLDSYVNEGGDCDTVDCDSQGDEQVSDLKILLVSTADAQKIIEGNTQDTIYNKYNEFEVLYDDLPNIEVARAFLTADVTTNAEVRAKFTSAIERDNILKKLGEGFELISNTFGVPINILGTLEASLRSLLINTETDFQYRYDLLKDLVATYNEIKDLLLHLKAECCPNIQSFPKHLMLGPVDASLELGENTPYRHDFYKSPILSEEDENYARTVLLAERFVQEIENFRKFIGPVRITPSKKDTNLGEKAVPFYYNVTDELLGTWDYEKSENDEEDQNLSYHKGNLASDDFVQNPLNYTLDDNNFFRIEGHLGQSYKIAYENINTIKAKYGLPFDIKTVMLRRKSADVISGPVRGFPITSTPRVLNTQRVALDPTIEVNDTQKVDLESTTDVNDTQRVSADLVSDQEVLRTAEQLPELSLEPETTEISIADLRQQLLEVSEAFVSNAEVDQQETLQTIANLDYQLNLLNEVEALTKPPLTQDGGVTVVTQDQKDDEIESELLSDFMERHSGLEHFAGVEPGGTFILVHESEDSPQVIADFSLPYLCCDKKDPVFLVLPVTQLCENDAPIPMTVIPLDGEIKAFANGVAIPGIVAKGGQSVFNPSLVPVANHEDQITFTVNDDPVETILTVFAQSQLEVTTSIDYGDANSPTPTAEVDFVLNNYNPQFTYEWNYGDGSPIDVNPPIVSNTVTHVYSLVVGQEEVYTPTVTITNTNGCSTVVQIEPVSLKLAINRNTQIRIYFDSSGSMNSSLAPLTTMKDGVLKNTLLPLYDNDLAAYNDKVKIRNFRDERTFDVLNLEGEAAPEGNVIVLVFQDEANAIYHSGSITPRRSQFETDITAFKGRLANNFGTGNPNYYRGVVFQVIGNSTFKTLMEAVENGNQSPATPSDYTSLSNNLVSEVAGGQVQFQYDVQDGDTAQQYFNIIKAALVGFGYEIPETTVSRVAAPSTPTSPSTL